MRAQNSLCFLINPKTVLPLPLDHLSYPLKCSTQAEFVLTIAPVCAYFDTLPEGKVYPFFGFRLFPKKAIFLYSMNTALVYGFSAYALCTRARVQFNSSACARVPACMRRSAIFIRVCLLGSVCRPSALIARAFMVFNEYQRESFSLFVGFLSVFIRGALSPFFLGKGFSLVSYSLMTQKEILLSVFPLEYIPP